MIELYGILQEQESINAELGLGVDYYKGEPGEQGIPGKDGKTPVKGVDYFTDAEITEIKDEIAEKVQVGAKGEDGKSAYQLAVEAGYEGSEADWLASLKGTDGRNGIDGINGTNGKDGKTPVKGVDYFTTAEINEIEEGAAAKVDLSNYAKTADLSTVATSGSYNDLVDKPTIPSTTGLASTKYVDDKVAGIVIPTVPTNVSAFTNDAGYLIEHQSLADYALKSEIPSTTNLATKAEVQEVENKIPTPYTLPTASTSTLGGVKVDGSTITITDGVISSKGGSGGSEPEKYIKDASVSGNTLTLTKKDDTEVVFTPSGGSGGDGSSYTLPVADMNTLGGIKVRLEPIKNEQINKIGTPLIYNEDVLTTAYIPKATVNYPGVVQLPSSNTGLYTNIVGDLDIKEATTTNLGTVAFDGITIKQNDNKVKQLYVPTATTSSLGVVKPDGTTTTVDSQGNLSMIGKPAVTKTLITGRAPDWVVDWVANPDKYIVIVNKCVVFKTMKSGTNFYYYWIDDDRIEHYYITFTDTTFTTPNSSQPSYSMAATQLITDVNWQNYITAGGGSDWQYTQDQYDSNLYNAKELVVCVENTQGNKQMGYFYFGYTEGGSSTTLGQNWQNTNFYFDYDISSPYISYNGTMLDCQNKNNLYFILYKT